MKVNYRKPISDRIIEVTHEAKAQNRAIESIELSVDEWKQLRDEMGLEYKSSLEIMRLSAGSIAGVPLKINNDA